MSAVLQSDRRRTLLGGLAAGGLAAGGLSLGGPARAQAAWPARPVALVVGFPPGGQTDFAGRVVANGMSTALGQSVVIENKAGVNGNIAAQDVLRAPADGYRLLVGNGAMTISPHVYTAAQMVDPQKLAPIGILLTSALILVVPATSPVKSFKDFAELAASREKSGKSLDYGSGGIGALTQVTMELMRERLGVKSMNHVPYKGSSPAMIDLVAGRLDAMFDAASVVAPFVKSGQLRAILATSPRRVPAFPDVPTAAEAGIKDFEVLSFIGLYGPPGLKGDVVAKANEAMNTALKDPSVIKNITDRGDEPGGGTPQDLAAITQSQFKTWGEVVKANNIRAD